MQDWHFDMLEKSISDLHGLTVHVERKLRELERPDPASPVRKAQRPIPFGRKFSDDVIANAARHVKANGLLQRIEQRAAVSPASTGTVGWAAELGGNSIAGYILSRQSSAFAAILRRSRQITLLSSGTTFIPYLSVPPSAAQVIPEGKPIPQNRATFAASKALPFKLASLIGFSEEIANLPNAEALMEAVLDESISAGLDLAGFSTNSYGLLNGVTGTPLTPNAGASITEQIALDLATVAAELARPSESVVFAVSVPSAITASALLPGGFRYPVLGSEAIPQGNIVAVDAARVSAALPSEWRVSTAEGVLVHEESAPLDIVDGAGIVAKPQRSMWQTSVHSLRVVASLGFAAPPTSVALGTGAGW